MSPEQVPDVHDPDIRVMVLRDHTPIDMWTVGGELASVHCERCGQRWPCPSIQAARAIEEARERHGEVHPSHAVDGSRCANCGAVAPLDGLGALADPCPDAD